MNQALLFIIIMLCFMICDMPFLLYNKQKYQNIVVKIQGHGLTQRYYAAIFVYVGLAIGLLYLVIPQINSMKDAIQYRNNNR